MQEWDVMNSVVDISHAIVEQDGIAFSPSASAPCAHLIELGNALKRCAYHFTTVSPATHARVNGRVGNEWARDLAGVFGWSRPFYASVLPSELFALMQDAGILIPYEDGFLSRLRGSSLGGELFFHSAYPTTENDSVFFGPDTYRFANAIDQFFTLHRGKIQRAIDIGCGAGPGAILVARHCLEAEVFASDINPAALRLTAVNAALAGTSRVKPCTSSLLDDVEGNFDLIISNPPYLVDPSKRAYRHGGGPLGAGLSLDIIDASLAHLNSGGTLLLYSGAAIVDSCDPFRQAVEQKLQNQPVQWTYQEMDPDIFGEELLCKAYARTDRIAAVVLTVTKQK
jgi:methylase of polypeptide subunit release factors